MTLAKYKLGPARNVVKEIVNHSLGIGGHMVFRKKVMYELDCGHVVSAVRPKSGRVKKRCYCDKCGR